MWEYNAAESPVFEYSTRLSSEELMYCKVIFRAFSTLQKTGMHRVVIDTTEMGEEYNRYVCFLLRSLHTKLYVMCWRGDKGLDDIPADILDIHKRFLDLFDRLDYNDYLVNKVEICRRLQGSNQINWNDVEREYFHTTYPHLGDTWLGLKGVRSCRLKQANTAAICPRKNWTGGGWSITFTLDYAGTTLLSFV